MKLSPIEIQNKIFQSYQEIQELITAKKEDIFTDKISLRALERLTGIIAVNVKRLKKLHPDWEIPQYKTILKVKKQLLWDCTELKPSYWKHLLETVLPAIHKFLSEKQNITIK